ncbi:MAG: hypothetical protein CK424_07260 [Legionella sp.]|nr:MAG: hypothetical protein CK424_07260 [Legionella sp.]
MTERGFSLSEVLIALLLMISISLALLKQQWQIHRLYVQMKRQNQHWLELSNARERSEEDQALFQRGFSLIECMIGLALSLSMMTLLMQEYMQISQLFHRTVVAVDHGARLQFVLNMIRHKGHQAGFTPCLPLYQLVSLDHRTGRALSTLTFDDRNPSKISMYRMQSTYVLVDAIEKQYRVYTSEKLSVHPQSPVIIADCHHAEVHTRYHLIPSHSHTVIEFSKDLAFHYREPIYVGEWVEESFGLNPKRQSQSGLFYQYHHHTDELMPEVTHLHWQLQRYQGQSVAHLEMDTKEQRHILLDIKMHHL